MNAAKARELFSEHLEGTMSEGLRQAFERALKADPDLLREYEEFKALIAEMDGMRHEAVAIPDDLHETIMKRVDRAVYDANRSRKPFWFLGGRRTFYGAVAGLALVGAALSLAATGGGAELADWLNLGRLFSPAKAPADQAAPKPRLEMRSGQLFLVAEAGAPSTLSIREDGGRPVVPQEALAGRAVNNPLENTGTAAAMLFIGTDRQPDQIIVVLPGSQRTASAEGEGTIRDFALAASGHFQVPMQVMVRDLGRRASWKFAEVAPRESIAAAAVSAGLTLDQRSDGLLVLSQ